MLQYKYDLLSFLKRGNIFGVLIGMICGAVMRMSLLEKFQISNYMMFHV